MAVMDGLESKERIWKFNTSDLCGTLRVTLKLALEKLLQLYGSIESGLF